MQHHFQFIQKLIEQQGPEPEDYPELDAWLAEISHQFQKRHLTLDQLMQLRLLFGDAITPKTLQGFVFNKPHGYAGDFEIIDLFLIKHISEDPRFRKWDKYTQSLAASKTLRSRKQYFKQLIRSHALETPLNVLNLASGPGRDMYELFLENPEMKVKIDCIEHDQNAIRYATALCQRFIDQIRFIPENMFRFSTDQKYNLVWSAGLFDYFNDKVFVFMLNKLKQLMQSGGEIIIGNFSEYNPSRAYMEFFDWHLIYRSPQALIDLGLKSGFARDQIEVQSEKNGVNLFLHLHTS